jgi:hypothetical protein
MATVTIDIILHVYNTVDLTAIGQKSIYTTVPHPGSGNTIRGWEWDKRTWPTNDEFEAAALAPSIWDPTSSGIDEDYFQSGYGDNNDILLLDIEEVTISGDERWAPKIQHGYFYSEKDEWYFYSDWYQTEVFKLTNTISGLQYADLRYDFKPTIPIQVRQFRFDKQSGRHEIALDLKKKVEFTTSGTDPEFIVNTDTSPPRLWLDRTYSTTVGAPVTTSGELYDLEFIGLSDGTAGQEFDLEYSPIDDTQPIEIWSWAEPTDGLASAINWTTISGSEQFTPGSGYEVKVDYDAGKISFGDYNPSTGDGSGAIPPTAHFVSAYYTKGLSAFYEPNHTRDYSVMYNIEADVNPITTSSPRGFVQIGVEPVEAASLTLTSSLPQINPFLIDLGNNVGELIATVKSKAGAPIEGQEVFFEILSPVIGTFGATAIQGTSISDADGEAITFYNSPATILGTGQATTNITHQSGNTVIEVDGLIDPGDVQRLFLYKIHVADNILGIPASGVDTYYTNYLAEEGIIEDPDGTAATRAFEEEYRSANSLSSPPTYDTADITTGKKTIILTIKDATNNVVDPNTGDLDSANGSQNVYSPLYPDTIEDIGSLTSPRLRITYNSILLDLPGTGTTKSYFAIGDVQTSIRAYAVNQRTNKKIYSNTIQMRVTLPDTASGTYFADSLSTLSDNLKNTLLNRPKNIDDIADRDITATQAIESWNREYLDERLGITETYIEWFRRTRKGDSRGMLIAESMSEYLTNSGVDGGLSPVQLELLAAGEIPLGFRLKSTGVIVSSLLDQITFVTPNDYLPSDYFDVKSETDSLGNQFEVV